MGFSFIREAFMKHIFRFLGEKVDGVWVPSPEDVTHFIKVLRLKDGDLVEVADGRGRWAVGRAEIRSKTSVEIREFDEFEAKKNEVVRGIALGAIKTSDFESYLPSLIELGLDEILIFYQSGQEKSRVTEKVLARWEKISRTAIKQCKRPWLPSIRYFDSLGDLLSFSDKFEKKFVLDAVGIPLTEGDFPSDQNVLGVVGSEAGISEEDMAKLEVSGFRKVSISDGILRARTAALALAANFSFLQHR